MNATRRPALLLMLLGACAPDATGRGSTGWEPDTGTAGSSDTTPGFEDTDDPKATTNADNTSTSSEPTTSSGTSATSNGSGLPPGETTGAGYACDEIGYTGVCEGDLLVWCEDGEIQMADCAGMGEVCEYQSDEVGYNCLPGGGLLTVSEIVGGVRYAVSQDYGPTNFDGGYSYCQSYGNWGGQLVHCGVDIAIAYGTPLYVPGNGTVLVSGESQYYEDAYNPGAGELKIQLEHDDAHVILGHMTQIDLSTGQAVTVGQAAGLSGTQNGAHVHIEVRVPDGNYPSGMRTVDPMIYFGP